jgi:CrcB protein
MDQAPLSAHDLPVDPDLGEGTSPAVLGAIGAGGALGGLARYAISSLAPAGTTGFAWATLAINVSGSFALGVLLVVLIERFRNNRYLRPFLGTGLLGAYTTFSAFAVEADLLIRSGRTGTAALYAAVSLAGGLAAAWAGILIAGRALGYPRR